MQTAEAVPQEPRKSKAVAIRKAAHIDLSSIDVSPNAILQRAIAEGAPLEQLEKFMELRERHEANEARKAFNAAFAAFKSEAVRIVKNTPVTDGPLKGKSYANLFDIVNAVTDPLAKHGLSASWKLTKDEKDWMEVTCILRHSAGHFESDTQGGAPDMGPGRNAIQARRSTRTYLEKSTLTGITGLAASDADDDGAGGKGAEADQTITEDQAGNLDSLIEGCVPPRETEAATAKAREQTVYKFLKALSSQSKLKIERVSDIPAKVYEDAVIILKNVKAAAK